MMRVGKRNQPSFRVVVTDSRSPRDGRIIEAIGHYGPRQDPSQISIDTDKAVFWLQRGAQPSNTVKKLLQISGAWSVFSGEAPPAADQSAATTKTAPAAPPRRATPAESVAEDGAPETEGLPEAVDQMAAAPDAGAPGEAS